MKTPEHMESEVKPSIELRPACIGDAEEIARLHVSVWQATYRTYAVPQAVATLDESKRLPYWKEWLSSEEPSKSTIVARKGETLVGVISYGPSTHEVFSGRMEVKHLYVDRSTQGQGVGARLLSTVLDHTQAVGNCGVALAVVRQNENARQFYRAMGGIEITKFIDSGPLWKSENILVAWD